jgi:glycosyltransferase involved in cell wall biosynthesis
MNYIIGIDASRCRSGGAIAHLIGIITNLNNKELGIKQIHIWSYSNLLSQIPDYDWLIKHSPKELHSNLLSQIFWQFSQLPKELRRTNCDILFTADAATVCNFHPQVVLSQDLLSYEPGILKLYKFNFHKIRLILIKFLQNASFKRATGVIFLTDYAKNVIQSHVGYLNDSIVIPHGVNTEFNLSKRIQNKHSVKQKFNCVYISNALLYKFQWTVIEAIELIRKEEGIDINITLVGGINPEAKYLVESQLRKSDPHREFVFMYPFLSSTDIISIINNSDVFVFASSCEAFGITLLEGMSMGIPIACSNRSCLPELLEDGGVYFDPENSRDIAKAIITLLKSDELKNTVSRKALINSSKYSWERCSSETFLYLIKNINKNKIHASQ